MSTRQQTSSSGNGNIPKQTNPKPAKDGALTNETLWVHTHERIMKYEERQHAIRIATITIIATVVTGLFAANLFYNYKAETSVLYHSNVVSNAMGLTNTVSHGGPFEGCLAPIHNNLPATSNIVLMTTSASHAATNSVLVDTNSATGTKSSKPNTTNTPLSTTDALNDATINATRGGRELPVTTNTPASSISNGQKDSTPPRLRGGIVLAIYALAGLFIMCAFVLDRHLSLLQALATHSLRKMESDIPHTTSILIPRVLRSRFDIVRAMTNPIYRAMTHGNCAVYYFYCAMYVVFTLAIIALGWSHSDIPKRAIHMVGAIACGTTVIMCIVTNYKFWGTTRCRWRWIRNLIAWFRGLLCKKRNTEAVRYECRTKRPRWSWISISVLSLLVLTLSYEIVACWSQYSYYMFVIIVVVAVGPVLLDTTALTLCCVVLSATTGVFLWLWLPDLGRDKNIVNLLTIDRMCMAQYVPVAVTIAMSIGFLFIVELIDRWNRERQYNYETDVVIRLCDIIHHGRLRDTLLNFVAPIVNGNVAAVTVAYPRTSKFLARRLVRSVIDNFPFREVHWRSIDERGGITKATDMYPPINGEHLLIVCNVLDTGQFVRRILRDMKRMGNDSIDISKIHVYAVVTKHSNKHYIEEVWKGFSIDLHNAVSLADNEWRPLWIT